MVQVSIATAALALLIVGQSHTAAAEGSDAGKAPPIIPASNEIAVRGVPAYAIHLELEQCLKDASTVLEAGNNALHVQIGTAQRFYSQESGFVLRADFTRDDVLPPLINRIICWHTGQLIASRISAPRLSPDETDKAIAVPRANPRQN